VPSFQQLPALQALAKPGDRPRDPDDEEQNDEGMDGHWQA
jgi:hypothetical protein